MTKKKIIGQRKSVTVDVRTQGALVLRVIAYWTFCMATMAVIVAASSLFSENRAVLWEEYRRVALIGFLPLPVVLLDVLIFSNRIAGPVYRFRKTLTSLNNGESVSRLECRKGDYYQDVAASLNTLVDRLEADGPPAAAAPERDAESECELVGSK